MLRMEERAPDMENILNKESRTADKGWSSSLGVGRGASNPSPQELNRFYESNRKPSEPD
jgi:hypothetical protein